MWGSVNLLLSRGFLKYMETAIFFTLCIFCNYFGFILSPFYSFPLENGHCELQSERISKGIQTVPLAQQFFCQEFSQQKYSHHVQKNSAPGTLASSLFLEHTRHTPTLGHLPGACPLPRRLFSQMSAQLPLSSLSSLYSNVVLSRRPTLTILFKLVNQSPPPHPKVHSSVLIFLPIALIL